jgi:hypothetical protein
MKHPPKDPQEVLDRSDQDLNDRLGVASAVHLASIAEAQARLY